MSVQVRRRREAASFLSSYVGAQGELIVETTNNRLQVHDGTMPGGWPAARLVDLPGRNAGINTGFAINQRAYASGAALAAGAYGHDRHKAGAGGCTYTFAQTVPDTAITITAGTLIQTIDASNVYAGACWLTWTGSAPARVWQGAASGAFSAGTSMAVDGVMVNALLVTGLTIGTATSIEWSTGTLGTVRPWQLEAALPNAGPTRLERRHLGVEMALCQRYYFTFPISGSAELFYLFQSGQGSLAKDIPFPVTMRAPPTIVFTAVCSGTFNSGMPAASGPSASRVTLRGDTSAGQYVYLTSFSASAEI